VQLAIIGDGPGLPDLRARSQRLGVAASVSFAGPTDEPLSALRAMTVFAHPSWAEAFPYVILEAMALGLPIVATAVGGVGEALVDGDSGVLIAPRDAGALARALSELLDEPRKMSALGARALGRARELFTLESMARDIEQVYSELI
jgi:glycosyltransferase involved in cell wall biosynthesis